MAAEVLIADKAYDRVLKPLASAGKSVVIPSRQNRIAPASSMRRSYQTRHLVKKFFCKLVRAIAMRYDKTARNFLAALHLAATIWLN
jgi:hypothetical protein